MTPRESAEKEAEVTYLLFWKTTKWVFIGAFIFLLFVSISIFVSLTLFTIASSQLIDFSNSNLSMFSDQFLLYFLFKIGPLQPLRLS